MRKSIKIAALLVLGLVLVIGAYVSIALLRPLRPLSPSLNDSQLTTKATASRLAWPATGQSAIGILGSSILTTHGAQTPVPTASTAKLITAMVVLKQKPLALGQQGPLITLGAQDVALYNAYVSEQGSVVAVQAGEQISEYQMLQAMLLPSANNMADSLAIWAYGSLPAYTAAANQFLAQQGLSETHVGSDASGFGPTTTSTAADLVDLGELTLQNPVLAQIVGQKTATGIPVVGTIKNVNSQLGTNGIIGIKTGNTNQAGGVYVSASVVTINNRPVTLVTALAGAPTLAMALSTSLPLITSAQANFQPVTLVKAGTVVGSYEEPWGGNVPAIASSNLTVTAWNGSPLSVTVHLRSIPASTTSSQTIGSLSTAQPPVLGLQSIGVQLRQPLSDPTIGWRLLHPRAWI